MTISFESEIADIEKTLQGAREELRSLEQQWDRYDIELTAVRAAIASLRKSSDEGNRQAEGVHINPETGRPSRGARREQLGRICRALGKRGATFRTVDVLNRVRDVEGEVSAGVRSYTYSTMNTFAEGGLLEKVGRGKWRLK